MSVIRKCDRSKKQSARIAHGKGSSTDMRLERHISVARFWSNIGKSCLSYAFFNFSILSPNNVFICTVTQSNDIVFKLPHAHNAKIHSANSSSLWIFLFHLFSRE